MVNKNMLRTVFGYDRKHLMLKIFHVQKFNFRGWSQPRKLNMDHTWCVTSCMSTVGTATMDTLRSLDRERREKLILLEMVLQNHSLHQLSTFDWTLDQIVTEGCGQIDTNDRLTSFMIKLPSCWCDRHRRVQKENYRWLSSKHQGLKGSCMQNVHTHKITAYITTHCKKNFVHKISRPMVLALYPDHSTSTCVHVCVQTYYKYSKQHNVMLFIIAYTSDATAVSCKSQDQPLLKLLVCRTNFAYKLVSTCTRAVECILNCRTPSNKHD